MTHSSQALSPVLGRLVHHVELQKAGWWQTTIERLIIGAAYLSDKAVDSSGFKSVIEKQFHASVTSEALNTALQSLVSRDELISIGNTFRLPQVAREAFEGEVAAAEALADAAKREFGRIVEEFVGKLTTSLEWDFFEAKFLRPLLEQTGADTYNLIAGSSPTAGTSFVDEFLNGFEDSQKDVVRDVVAQFLDPKNETIREYIGMMLHAHFCVSSSGLSSITLKKIESMTRKKPRFRLFVDTNFLFSLIRLHDNPSNETADELRQLIGTVDEYVDVGLYITTRTIAEAQSSIRAAKFSVEGISAATNITYAALNSGLSGIAVRFFRERASSVGYLSAEDYFQPYLKDFTAVARTRGVELYNEKLDAYSKRQDVIDTINERLTRQYNRGSDKKKTYEVIEHDAMLWHFVTDKRPVRPESPTEAESWILTVDYGFIRFDAARQRTKNLVVPVCIHPTSLMQLLRFWVPRSEEFEEAMLGSLRLPFLFRKFDASAEKTSIRILQAISRFEGVEDLPREAVTSTVVNESLRSRIQEFGGESDPIDLVKDELVVQVGVISSEKDQAIKEMEEGFKLKERDLALLEEENAHKSRELESLAAKHRETQRELQSIKQTIEKQMQEKESIEEKLSKLAYGVCVFGIFICSLLSASFLFPRLNNALDNGKLNLPVVLACTFLSAYIVFALLHLALASWAERKGALVNWRKHTQLVRLRNWLWSAAIVTVVLGWLVNRLS